MQYIYRIKVPKFNNDEFIPEWEYKAFDIGVIEAKSKKEAREKIEKDLGINFTMRSKKEDIGTKNIYLLQIWELDNYFKDLWLKEHTCKTCNRKYNKIQRDKAIDFSYMPIEYCSKDCYNKAEKAKKQRLGETFDFDGKHNAVIYKITNKKENKCYIGKTTQPFTLRWYQHFFQTSDTKFHQAIKGTSIIDWKFEILEVFPFSGKDIDYKDSKGYAKLLSKKEDYWINYFDSINNGYNTAKA